MVLERMEHAVPNTIAAKKTTSSKGPHFLLLLSEPPPLIVASILSVKGFLGTVQRISLRCSEGLGKLCNCYIDRRRFWGGGLLYHQYKNNGDSYADFRICILHFASGAWRTFHAFRFERVDTVESVENSLRALLLHSFTSLLPPSNYYVV